MLVQAEATEPAHLLSVMQQNNWHGTKACPHPLCCETKEPRTDLHAKQESFGSASQPSVGATVDTKQKRQSQQIHKPRNIRRYHVNSLGALELMNIKQFFFCTETNRSEKSRKHVRPTRHERIRHV